MALRSVLFITMFWSSITWANVFCRDFFALPLEVTRITTEQTISELSADGSFYMRLEEVLTPANASGSINYVDIYFHRRSVEREEDLGTLERYEVPNPQIQNFETLTRDSRGYDDAPLSVTSSRQDGLPAMNAMGKVELLRDLLVTKSKTPELYINFESGRYIDASKTHEELVSTWAAPFGKEGLLLVELIPFNANFLKKNNIVPEHHLIFYNPKTGDITPFQSSAKSSQPTVYKFGEIGETGKQLVYLAQRKGTDDSESIVSQSILIIDLQTQTSRSIPIDQTLNVQALALSAAGQLHIAHSGNKIDVLSLNNSNAKPAEIFVFAPTSEPGYPTRTFKLDPTSQKPFFGFSRNMLVDKPSDKGIELKVEESFSGEVIGLTSKVDTSENLIEIKIGETHGEIFIRLGISPKKMENFDEQVNLLDNSFDTALRDKGLKDRFTRVESNGDNLEYFISIRNPTEAEAHFLFNFFQTISSHQ